MYHGIIMQVVKEVSAMFAYMTNSSQAIALVIAQNQEKVGGDRT